VAAETPGAASVSFREQFPLSCPLGFTRKDLARYFGDRLTSLDEQLYGQTQTICDGRRFNHDTREYEPTECADTPHGVVAYVWDVQDWYEGRPVSDW